MNAANPRARRAVLGLSATLFAAVLAACAGLRSESPTDALARASQAMGAGKLQSVRYSAEGTGWTFGQAYLPGQAWPKITVHAWTRSIDYAAGSMREEITLSRAEPLGGGGYPLSGQQRNDQYVSGDVAWNVVGGNVVPGPRFVAERLHQLWITPHGVLKAAARYAPNARRDDDGTTTLGFVQPGRLQASIVIGPDGLVRQVDSTYPDPVLGDTSVTTTYEEYRDVGDGVRFPARIKQWASGHPTLELAVKDVQVNPAVYAPVPDAARAPDRVTADRVADGVWFLGGGSHNSALIEMPDHLVLIEAPLNDARTLAVIQQARQLVPGKPIRYLVNSHAHFDHSGGVRAAAGEGATIVTLAANAAWFEKAFATPNRIRPDRLAQSGQKPSLLGVADRHDLGTPARPIELHRIVGGPHSDSMLLVWLPKEKLLIEADAYTPAAPGAAPPAAPNANNVNLVENIERLRLPVERILPLHGRVVPVGELYAAIGKAAPAR